MKVKMTGHHSVMARAVGNDWYRPKQHMIKAEKLPLKARLHVLVLAFMSFVHLHLNTLFKIIHSSVI